MGETTKRIQTFDIARGLAITLVVLGHSIVLKESTWISHVIFLANLPIFFFLSGYFARPQSTPRAFYRGINTLLLPYVVGAGLFFCTWSIFHNHFQMDVIESILMGNAAPGYFPWFHGGYLDVAVGVFWFLPTMFLANILFQLILHVANKINPNWQAYLVFFIGTSLSLGAILIGWFGPMIGEARYPFGLLTAIHVQIFYAAGYLLNKMKKSAGMPVIVLNGWVTAGAVLIVYVTAMTGTYGLNNAYATQPILAIVSGFGTSFILLRIARFIEENFARACTLISWAGRYSIVLYTLHALDFNVLNNNVVSAILGISRGQSLLIWTLSLLWFVVRITVIYVTAQLLVKNYSVNKILVDRDWPMKA
ncbi:acyltransferase family protein [Weissella confusa]|uniref:acyltransferase family protein n=1 Tax=Weissella confusa TaxID=1583 RepID=UPI002A75B859|nr:acyltransferase family protein [Weissella confusa]MDY2512994.1 acyltransferase family protein [Weissella confusa]